MTTTYYMCPNLKCPEDAYWTTVSICPKCKSEPKAVTEPIIKEINNTKLV